MKKLLKFLLIVFIWLVILGISLAVTILLGYPENKAFKVFAVIFCAWYGIKLVVYLYNRWQAKKRVEKLINIDNVDSDRKQISFFQFLLTKDIDRHLQKVISRVSKNEVGTQSTSNLIWAMHLKLDNQHSDWLKQSSVNKPKFKDPIFEEYSHINWMVFNQFMMLDVDSYLMQENNPSAKSEWLQLLNGLSYSSKRSSLDSLVISVHIDELKDKDSRNNFADVIRTKHEEIKEHCGVDVAVSIVLIGMEQIGGISSWLTSISEDWKSEVLGHINQNRAHSSLLIDGCFEQLNNALEQGSLNSLVTEGFNSTLANLPRKAQDVKSSLSAFTERFFSPSQFQTAPVCSGFFIVMKKGSDYIFVDSLLENRSLCYMPSSLTYCTTVSDIKKRKKIIAYSAASVLLSIMLLILHSNDKEQIEQILTQYDHQISNSKEKAKLVENFQARYQLIQHLSALNIGHWLASAADSFNVPTLEVKLKSDIIDFLIEPIDSSFEQRLATFDGQSLDAKFDYLNVLMRRINILNAASRGTSLVDLQDFPQPFDSAYIEDMPNSMIININDIYLKSLIMTRSSESDEYINDWRKQITTYREVVSSLLVSSDGTMEWLTDWVDNNSSSKAILLKDYWKGSKQIQSNIKVKSVFTVEGKNSIDAFIEQLTYALGDEHPFLVTYLSLFQEQYEKNYIANWGVFLQNFNQGEDSLNDREEWLNVINNLTNSRNIFFKVLNDADEQLAPFKDMAKKPDWFEFIIYYQDMLALGQDEKQSNPKKNKVFTKLALKVVSALGPVGKALSGSAKSGLKTKKKLDKAEGAGPGATERELNIQEAATALDNYKISVADLVFNIEQKQQSYSNVKRYFESENAPSTDTQLGSAKLTINKLQSLIGKTGISTAAFWNVYSGAIDLLENFMMQDAACYIDQSWQDDYLYELYGIPDYKMDSFAYGDAGVLWQFVDEKLSPFLQKRPAGFSLKRVSDKKIPLSAELINYLIRAKDLSQNQKYTDFNLSLTAMPTDLSEDALLYVSKTEIALQCAAGDQKLINNNFIVKSQFNWEASCKAVSVKITIGNKIIEKFYGGETGVYDFLDDFKSGVKRFELEEFPNHFYLLNQYKIKHIDVRLEIDGGLKLMNSLLIKPPQTPKTISACWV
jgi:type VI secretion system protein ImpL